jgi:hypothetical protein
MSPFERITLKVRADEQHTVDASSVHGVVLELRKENALSVMRPSPLFVSGHPELPVRIDDGFVGDAGVEVFVALPAQDRSP